MKRIGLNLICAVLVAVGVAIMIWSKVHGWSDSNSGYDDGIQHIDANTVFLEASGVEVSFSDVVITEPGETRKLIVSEQNGSVSTELTDKLIQKLDFEFLKKTQKVSYTGKGYFVVDLDKLTKADVIEDKSSRTVTIRVGHAYLQAIEVDPDKIMIDAVKEGLLARGDIELTLHDYNAIEKDIRTRLEEKFNTAENGQKADAIALEMVKKVYEPVIQAIDGRYKVLVEFK